MAFACLGLLGSVAYAALRPRLLVAALSVFGALIEVIQLIPALNRDADPLDWLADTAAVAAVVLAVSVWRRTRPVQDRVD